MMDGFDGASGRARDVRRGLRRARRGPVGAGRPTGPAEALNQTVNTQPVMLTAGVAVWRAWQRGGRRRCRRSSPATASANTRRWSPPARSRSRDARAAGALSRAGDAGGGARRASARWRRSSASTTTRVAAACARGGAGRGGRAGELQRAGPGRDRRPPRGGRARDRRGQGARREARVLLPVSAPFHSSLLKPAAERLAARLAQRRVRGARDSRDAQRRRREHTRRPTAIRAALAQQAASPVRWAETIQAFAARGVTHVVECGPGQGAGRAEQAHRRATRRRFALDRRRRRSTQRWRRSPADDASRSDAMSAATLDGQVALVTGATRGIGRAIALDARRATARRWSARRPPTTAPRAISALSRRRGQRRRRACGSTSTDAAAGRRACSPTSSSSFGADHDPRQQRRHHARQPAAADEGRRVGRGHGDQPQAGVPAGQGACCAA